MPRKPVTPATDRPLTGEERARERRDMKVVQRLADGVAHELNNVLTAIIGRTSVLLAELERGSAPYRDVEAILAAGRSGLDLTKNLLSFSGAQRPELESMALNELIQRVTAPWQRSEPKIDIELALAEDLRPVMGDASQLRRMLVHLGLNAIEAMPDSGTLTFTSKNVTLEPGSSPTELAPGPYVRLQVSDSGIGMDPETLHQAFEPFFTTRASTGAAGLGLPFVANTVKNHGGYVELFSKKGLGTTVTIWFPAAAAVTAAAGPPAPAPGTGDAVVLVVDDDPLVLGTSVRLLSKLGYSVVTAVDGEDALSCYDSQRSRIAVIVADLIMPGMDGIQLTSRLLAADPAVRVVLCSATPDEDAERRCLAVGAVYFLPKPYTLEQLSQAIAAARAA
jgi:two-component system, cell cycle sensor histidine kinase and response regulator CckA